MSMTLFQILKLYAWEPSFEQSVNDVRREELAVMRKQSYVNAGVGMAWTSTQFLVRSSRCFKLRPQALPASTSALLIPGPARRPKEGGG